MGELAWIDLAVLVLASFRLTHLIVFDEITSFLRDPFFTVVYEPDETGQEIRRIEYKGAGWRRWIGKLLSCHWCLGVWSSAAVTAIYWWLPMAYPLLVVLAVAGAAAVIETKLYFG